MGLDFQGLSPGEGGLLPLGALEALHVRVRSAHVIVAAVQSGSWQTHLCIPHISCSLEVLSFSGHVP